MFSSSNSISSELHLSPSNFLLTPPFLPQNENENIFLPQQNHEMFLNPKKKNKRKDRHSKIYTAHGLRDRRVRLSIDIACKFFKLQDMLGFDKASKTISWLLKNSESSIKELEAKQILKSDGFEDISPISELCEGELGTSVKNTLVKIKEKKMNIQNRSSFSGHTRESRAMARARARERTREKNTSTQKIDDPNPSISIRSNNLVSDIEPYEGLVGDVINGSPSIPKFVNPLITQKDWDKYLFAEYEVFSKYFEAFNH